MKYLLDTHIFLWWLRSDPRLKKSARDIINNPDNVVYVSVASAWEVCIKQQIGKLQLKKPFTKYFKDMDFLPLRITLEHVLQLNKLPNYHKDPFDRILIAQALAEGCTLITTDLIIKKYKVPTVA